MKPKEIYKETFKKGAYFDKQDLIVNAKKSHLIEVMNKGKMSDGSEFITVKVFVK